MSEAIDAVSALSPEQLMMDYAVAMVKRSMTTQETLSSGLIEMMEQPQPQLPPQPQPLSAAMGTYIDTYA